MHKVRWFLPGAVGIACSLVALSVSGACNNGPSQVTFNEDYAAAYCDKASICLWPDLGDDYDACFDAVSTSMESLERECGNYNDSLATDCIREVRNMHCDDGLDYLDPDLHPFSCRAVYDCYGTTN